MSSIVGKWVIDPTDSSVTFSVRHLLSKVTGRFGEFKGEADVLDNISLSTVHGVVDVTTITTDDEERDAHIRSPEFFDVGNYPTITFRTNSWNTSESSSEIVLEGELTIKDVTRPITFTGTFGNIEVGDFGSDTAELKLTAKIDRKDWGLEWDSPIDAAGIILGEDVTIVVTAKAIRTDPEPDETDVPTGEPGTPAYV